MNQKGGEQMYRIIVGNLKYECDSIRELAELERYLESKGARTAQAESMPSSERYCAFLRTVLAAGEGGVPSRDLASAVGLRSGKGLGAIFNNLRSALSDHNIAVEDAVDRIRVGTERRWVARDRAQEALEALSNNN